MKPIGMKAQLFILWMTGLLLTNEGAMAQRQWLQVGPAGFSSGNCLQLSLTVDISGNPYLAYNYYDNTNMKFAATVMEHNSGSWSVVGYPDIYPDGAENLSIIVDKNYNPCVSFTDEWSDKAGVGTYNGLNWGPFGLGWVSSGTGYSPSLSIDSNNTLYLAYVDGAIGDKATVKKSSGAIWSVVGNAGFSTGSIRGIVSAVSKKNTLFVAYCDATDNYRVTVKKFDGTSWATVGNAAFTPDDLSGYYISLAVDNNDVPYLAFQDKSRNYKATVMKYNGTSWIVLGTAGLSPTSVDQLSMVIDGNNQVYLGYLDRYSYKATVMQHNGVNWSVVGLPDFTSATNYIDLAVSPDNILYLAYVDVDKASKATVMKFDCIPHPHVDICAVSTDTVSGMNTIVWNGNGVPLVRYYRIYREDNGRYIRVGNVPGNTNSFTDLTANASLQSYRYKLAILDSCDREDGILSLAEHKTIKLGFSYLSTGQASITWNSYTGLVNPLYVIKRSNNGSSFTAIDSMNVNGVDTLYVDNNAPPGSNRYRIETMLSTPCTNGAITYDRITSNTVTSWNAGIEDLYSGGILIKPNPAQYELSAHISEKITGVDVFDMMGKKLISEGGAGSNSCKIHISDLSPGMYLLRINGRYKATFVKY